MRLSYNVGAGLGAAILLALPLACGDDDDNITGPSDTLECSPNNGGITLPANFCAIVVADLTSGGAPARARHLVVLPNGDIFVAINSPNNEQPAFGIIGLRDTDGDGDSDQTTQFSPGLGGSGLAWLDGKLYLGANDRVVRFTLPSGQMTPTGAGDVVVAGLVATGDHISKTVVVPNATTMYVNIGSASNSCQVDNRDVESPGVFPCPEFATRAGIWRFDPAGTNQTLASGTRFATGYRNMVALAFNPRDGQLYGAQHGRDALFDDWPDMFDVNDDAALPSEELVRITANSDNGWPYCYHDGVATTKRKVLAPEYGGDGSMVTGPNNIDCSTYNTPVAIFGAHWAPNGMHFYNGTQFPAKYRGGAFVAFHGGFDRAPLPNEGYKVMFVPAGANGQPTGTPEVFADGFAGSTGPLPANAVYRPVGVVEGPDGSLYITDDKGGRVWRVIYRP